MAIAGGIPASNIAKFIDVKRDLIVWLTLRGEGCGNALTGEFHGMLERSLELGGQHGVLLYDPDRLFQFLYVLKIVAEVNINDPELGSELESFITKYEGGPRNYEAIR